MQQGAERSAGDLAVMSLPCESRIGGLRASPRTPGSSAETWNGWLPRTSAVCPPRNTFTPPSLLWMVEKFAMLERLSRSEFICALSPASWDASGVGLILLIQSGDLCGELVNLRHRAAGLALDAGRDLRQAGRGLVEALRHLAGRVEDALPGPRIVGAHAQARKTVEQRAHRIGNLRSAGEVKQRLHLTQIGSQLRRIAQKLLLVADILFQVLRPGAHQRPGHYSAGEPLGRIEGLRHKRLVLVGVSGSVRIGDVVFNDVEYLLVRRERSGRIQK